MRDVGQPRFQVLSFRDVRRGRLRFADGERVDMVHAFTPRAPVRSLTLGLARRHRCPYVVHLEDNETAVQAAVPGAHDATAVESFLEEAAGLTVVIDRLLEFKPHQLPGIVIWPGYDEAIDRRGRTRDAIRRDIGLGKDDLAVVYPGNIHRANASEVTSLYQAVRSLRGSGRNVVLVKSGWNYSSPPGLPKLGAGIRDLGWVSRRRVFELLHAADVLVQPGSPGPFNDYRFPSKLPEFLASARPVILPRSNIGLHLEDGVEALLLDRGDAVEICERVLRLHDDASVRERLGEAGRAFALCKLQWSKNVPAVADLYKDIGLEPVATKRARA